MQDRRNFLNSLLNIKNYEQSIWVKKEHIEDMKLQLTAGIDEKDRFGHAMNPKQLKREITFAEFQLEQLQLALDFAKEDMYYILYVKEGVVSKAGSLEDLKDKVNAHFLLMREEWEKVKKVIQDAV